MEFHPKPFRQRTSRRLGCAVDRCTRSKHFDPENRSDVDDVTALLLLHVRQGSGNAVQKTLDIDVNLLVPFLYLERTDRRDEHNTCVIDEHIDAAESLDGALY